MSLTDWGDWSLNNEAGTVVTITEDTVLVDDALSSAGKEVQAPNMSDDGGSPVDKKIAFNATQGLDVSVRCTVTMPPRA